MRSAIATLLPLPLVGRAHAGQFEADIQAVRDRPASAARRMDGQGLDEQIRPAGLEFEQDVAQRLRPDVVTETNERDRYQENAASVADGLYLVPKVIE